MPTRYYLVGSDLVRAVSQLEAAGGVRAAERDIPALDIAATHEAYERERDTAVPSDHVGPRPSGGVGGTRQGVKCLHAHLAHLLAGGDDPVGRWAAHRLSDPSVLDGLVPPFERSPSRSSVEAAANPDIGGLTVNIDDETVHISMTGGGSWTIDIGPAVLARGELAQADPPRPANLTNALGVVHDHIDDVIVNHPSVLATPSVMICGRHAATLAAVEVGHATIPHDYRLTRAAADEVFRTLVAEPIEERRFNPGLEPDDVETIIGTLCVVLAIMRRLDLHDVGVDTGTTLTGGDRTQRTAERVQR
jgi:hypothetical protein